MRIRRFENIGPAGVAVKRLGTEAAHELHLLGADVERGERNALRRQDAGDDLPETADPPVVQKQDPDSFPIIMFSVSAPMPVVELTTYLEQNVQKRLESINGVGEVLLFGARRREIQVQIDPDRLNAYGLSTTDVAAALRSQNLELPGGRLEQGTRELSVRTVGRLRTPDTPCRDSSRASKSLPARSDGFRARA